MGRHDTPVEHPAQLGRAMAARFDAGPVDRPLAPPIAKKEKAVDHIARDDDLRCVSYHQKHKGTLVDSDCVPNSRDDSSKEDRT